MSTRWRTIRPCLIGAVCAVLFAPAASAAAPAPRDALFQALGDVHALASQASVGASRKPLLDAATQLTSATIPPLWIDARNADGPSYGTRVFTDSLRAVTDLQRVGGSPIAAAGIALIVGADRGLAQGVGIQARGASQRLLREARHAVASGDREAASHPASAVRAYTEAWKHAFAALTALVASQISRVPSSEVAAAAENALGTRKIGLSGPMIAQGQPPLTLAGKPEMFYAGSEACPFCGVERWGMIVALSQFGTFSNLHLMQSSPTESPEVRTFTFFGSSYKSPYISFVPVEAISNVPTQFGFAHLQPLTPLQLGLVNQFDQGGQVPFIDVANRFITVQSTVLPHLIRAQSWTQLTKSLSDPSSTAAQAIAGEAEVLSAEVCEATNGKPAICSTAVVHQYEAALPSLNGRGGGCPAATAAAVGARRQSARRTGAQAARCH